MGYFYLLENAKRKEKAFLEAQKNFQQHSQSFPEEDLLTDDHRSLIRKFLLLRAEIAILWYQIAKRCPSTEEARIYYEKSAQLGYFLAQQKINFPREVIVNQEADLLTYPLYQLIEAARKRDPAGCYWYAVYLHKVAAVELHEQTIAAEDRQDFRSAAQYRSKAIALSKQAFHLYNYAAIQHFPLALVDTAWIIIHDLARDSQNPCTPEEQKQYSEKANQYLTLAMEHDHAEAFYKKGLQFQKGWCEEINNELALKHFRNAAKQNFTPAKQALNEYYLENRSPEHIKEYLDDPEHLATVILDAQLGVYQADLLLRDITKRVPLHNIENPFVQELLRVFPLVQPDELTELRQQLATALSEEQQLELVMKISALEAKEQRRPRRSPAINIPRPLSPRARQKNFHYEPLTESILNAYPHTLGILLQVNPASKELLEVAMCAYAAEKCPENKKIKIKECIRLLINDDTANLGLLIQFQMVDLEILNWILEYRSFSDLGIKLEWKETFILKLLTHLPAESFNTSDLYASVQHILRAKQHPLLQTVQRWLLQPVTEEEKTAVYEAQYGHNGLSLFLGFLYIIATGLNDDKTLEALQKRKINFSNLDFFKDPNASILLWYILQEAISGNTEILKLLIQSTYVPPELKNIYFFPRLYALKSYILQLLTPTTENIKAIENLLGTREDVEITLRKGFLSELIKFFIIDAADDESAFQFTESLVTTGSAIIQAAIRNKICELVGRLIEKIEDFVPNSTPEKVAKNATLFSKISRLLARPYFDSSNYDQLQKKVILISPHNFEHFNLGRLFSLLYVAVTQEIWLTNPQLSELVPHGNGGGTIWSNGTITLYSDLNFRPIITELLISPEHSAFWQVLDRSSNYDPRNFYKIHKLRRSLDQNYLNFVRQLSAYTDPSFLQLIYHGKNQGLKETLKHRRDYLYLLHKNKKQPAQVLILLYICEKLKIHVPEDLLDELCEFRHELIDWLSQSRTKDLAALKNLLLDITNYERIDAEHNEENRTYLSTVFRKKRGWLSPDPESQDDAIAKAYRLLAAINKLKPSKVTSPALSLSSQSGSEALIALRPSSDIAPQLVSEIQKDSRDPAEKPRDNDYSKRSTKKTDPDDEDPELKTTPSFSLGDILGTVINGLAERFAHSGDSHKITHDSWPKQKKGSDAEIITKTSSIISEPLSEDQKGEEGFNFFVGSRSVPALRPDPRDQDSLL